MGHNLGGSIHVFSCGPTRKVLLQCVDGLDLVIDFSIFFAFEKLGLLVHLFQWQAFLWDTLERDQIDQQLSVSTLHKSTLISCV
ncbi:hypothetical protein L1987_73867 [Smallanthus sonchifolius]|uniref:Uncharacterized protein n=1 Tax=Smallanthus sonchifolius TaxID=185202 RepID=A0ACB9A5K1_9ASTR|nr:hypothetical protein L1987_73867 [Smallanthus sonchifolius]